MFNAIIAAVIIAIITAALLFLYDYILAFLRWIIKIALPVLNVTISLILKEIESTKKIIKANLIGFERSEDDISRSNTNENTDDDDNAVLKSTERPACKVDEEEAAASKSTNKVPLKDQENLEKAVSNDEKVDSLKDEKKNQSKCQEYDRASNTASNTTSSKIPGKHITKTAGKAAGQAIAKAGVKGASKAATKAGIGIGKSCAKKIPVVGLVAGGAFATWRAGWGIYYMTQGKRAKAASEFTKAGLEVASGAASMVPGVGTGTSIAIDAGLIAWDVGEDVSSTSTKDDSKDQKSNVHK